MTDRVRSETEMPVPTAEVYSQRDNPAFEAWLAAKTAPREGAFFLPHLRSGMRVLDVGCGPGSITVGLAEAVAPGEVIGVDLQPAMVEQAQAQAARHNVPNVRFEVASVYDLPFPSGSFDAVLVCGLLIGLREPVPALQEIRRVLLPGGIVGLRDADMGADIFTPMTPLLEQWWALRPRILQRNGGQPLGRHHRWRLLEAGFARAEASASPSSGGSLADARQHAAFFKAQLTGQARTAIAEGWLDQSTVDAIAVELDTWA